MIRTLIFALLFTAAQAFGQGCTSTATIPPPMIAPFSGFTGTGTFVANPEPLNYLATGCFGPNNPILRATDGNTALSVCNSQGGSCTGKVNRSMYAANSDGSDNHCTINDEQCWVVDSGNAAYILDFHGMTSPVTWHYINFPNCVLKFCGDPTASYTRAKTFLGFANAGGTAAGTVLSYYDTSTTWPTLPTRTTIIDFAASGNGVPVSAVNLTDPVTCNHAETKCGTGFSTTVGQGSSGAVYVAAYTIGSGMSVWDTGTGMITGDYGSTGAAVCQNCAGAPISPGTFTIHNVKWSQDMTYAIVQTTDATCVGCLNGPATPYIWQVGTTNIYTTCGPSGHCSGHFVSNGQLNFITEYSTPNWVQKGFTSQTGTTFPVGTTCTNQHDQHASWLNDNTTDTLPFFGSTTWGSSGNPVYGSCGVDEIDAWDPPTIGDNKVFRAGHNYGANVTEFAGQEQIGWVTADGKYFFYTSPMANSSTFIGQLGGTDGTYPALSTAISRSDIFVLQLSGGAPLAPSPLFGFTETSTSPGNFPTVNYGMQRIWDSPPLQWPSINTAAGVFNYTNLDTMLAQDFTNGVTEIMYTLSRTPPWATSQPTDTMCHYQLPAVGGGPGECYPATDLNADGSGTNATWKAWITSIATHANNQTYLTTHAHIRYWEIWNEPDAAFYWSGSFAQLSRLTEDANCIITGRGVIHQSGNGTATACTATAIDPTAVIVMSSGHATSAAVLTYAQNQLYCNNTAGIPAYQLPCPNPANATAAALDVINFHLKPGDTTGNHCPAPSTPCTVETAMATYLSNIHGILQPSELNKPLWDGEMSYAIAGFIPPYDNHDNGASFFPRMYLTMWSLGFSGSALYTWDNLKAQGAQVEASAQQTYNYLTGASLSPACASVGTVWSCTITKAGVPSLILWDTSKTCSVSCPTANQTVAAKWATYQDMTSASSPIAIVANTVPVGIKPIILNSGVAAVAFTNPTCGSPPCPLPSAIQSQAYSYLMAATGGTGPYTFSVSSGTLPTGLSLNSAGCGFNTNCNIQGTASILGTSSFTLQVCDAIPSCVTLAVTLPVVVTNPPSPAAIFAVLVSQNKPRTDHGGFSRMSYPFFVGRVTKPMNAGTIYCSTNSLTGMYRGHGTRASADACLNTKGADFAAVTQLAHQN